MPDREIRRSRNLGVSEASIYISVDARHQNHQMLMTGHDGFLQTDMRAAPTGSQMQAGFAFSRLADRMASLVEVSPGDLKLLADMPTTISHLESHQILVSARDRPTQCCLVLQGYLCWQDGRSHDGQITSIYVPGDIPDLFTLHGWPIDGILMALGPAVVAFVPHQFLRELSIASPAMSRALLLMLLSDHAIQRNWTINLGSRDALTRVAHLLCEIITRLQTVGLGKDFKLSSPFTQSDIAAACSISPVHANRIVQELRRSSLLQWQAKTITILDWCGLVRLADFDASYLAARGSETTVAAPRAAVVRPPPDRSIAST